MKKFSIIAVLVLSVFAIQSCKKSSGDDTSTTTAVLFNAYLNGTLWTPTTTTATITYSAANNTKTFNCVALTSVDEILLSIKVGAAAKDSGFTGTTTYTADSIKTKTYYYTLTNGVPKQVGSFKAGSIYITSADSTGKTITGSFSFNQTKAAYDSNGNVVSVTNTAITSGQFNALPYKYIKQ